jgi:MoaA/NifB/PqqE/SkfB family radical SAM enzyme
MKKVFLHSTYDCNANCIHCAVPRRKEYISFSLFKKIVDNFEMDFMIIGGGEPLKHPNIEEMIVYASNETKVKIETNGSLLSKEFLERNSKNLFQLNVSLDGTRETHNMIRGVPIFDHTIQMISYARSLGIDVAVWSVVMNNNFPEINDIISLVKGIGVEKISFLYATPVGKCDRDLIVDYSKYMGLVEEITSREYESIQIRIAPYILSKKNKLENLGCLINEREILHIDPRGDIYPCVLLLDNPSYKIGSIDKGYTSITNEDTCRCLGLVESLGDDNRISYGFPVCPSITLSREWNFE